MKRGQMMEAHVLPSARMATSANSTLEQFDVVDFPEGLYAVAVSKDEDDADVHDRPLSDPLRGKMVYQAVWRGLPTIYA